jgi:hypothetical protein
MGEKHYLMDEAGTRSGQLFADKFKIETMCHQGIGIRVECI